MSAPHLDPSVRHDIVFLFDVTDGNPNGDPDAGNRPRMDDESGNGLVTDVAIKRKIRDTLVLAAGDDARYRLFVEAGHPLNPRLEEAYTEAKLPLNKVATHEQAAPARQWLCERYFDIRLFGAVMSMKSTPSLGQIRGPLQVTIARSIDPVYPLSHTITRVARNTQAEVDEGKETQMGDKWTVPYGLYRCELYYSANRGKQTGVDSRDLQLLYQTLEMMFDHDRSAARGRMAARGIYVFSHADAFGSAPAHRLTERVHVTRAENTESAARSFGDYVVSVDDTELPDGVTMTKLIS
jgi:CRISPR-associated protein Csd2